MSRVYCGVCGLDYVERCGCVSIASEEWDAAKEAWRRQRRTLTGGFPNPELAALDAFFFAGEQTEAPRRPDVCIGVQEDEP